MRGKRPCVTRRSASVTFACHCGNARRSRLPRFATHSAVGGANGLYEGAWRALITRTIGKDEADVAGKIEASAQPSAAPVTRPAPASSASFAVGG